MLGYTAKHAFQHVLCATVFLQDFASVAEKTGTYTAFDYADIMDHLIKRWDVAGRRDLTGEVSDDRLMGASYT